MHQLLSPVLAGSRRRSPRDIYCIKGVGKKKMEQWHSVTQKSQFTIGRWTRFFCMTTFFWFVLIIKRWRKGNTKKRERKKIININNRRKKFIFKTSPIYIDKIYCTAIRRKKCNRKLLSKIVISISEKIKSYTCGSFLSQTLCWGRKKANVLMTIITIVIEKIFTRVFATNWN